MFNNFAKSSIKCKYFLITDLDKSSINCKYFPIADLATLVDETDINISQLGQFANLENDRKFGSKRRLLSSKSCIQVSYHDNITRF